MELLESFGIIPLESVLRTVLELDAKLGSFETVRKSKGFDFRFLI